MKNTNDQYRHYLDEVESMVENEKRVFRDLKESIKDSFSFDSIPELLKKRRRAFDHALVECINKYGFGNGNIRASLDEIWDNNKIEQASWKKYLRPTKYLFGGMGYYFDDTYVLKTKQWHSYLEASLELAKNIGESND